MDGFLAGVAQHYPGFEPRTVVADELPYTMASGRALLDIARARHPDSDLLLFSSDLLAAGRFWRACARASRCRRRWPSWASATTRSPAN